MQEVLVYIILFTAIGYLAKKFILPKSLFATTKKSPKSCGIDSGNCGCP